MHHNIYSFKRLGAVLFALFAMSVSSSSQTLINSVPVFNVTHDDFGIVIGSGWSSIEVQHPFGFSFAPYQQDGQNSVSLASYSAGDVVYFSELYPDVTLEPNEEHRLFAIPSEGSAESFIFHTLPSDWSTNADAIPDPLYAFRLEGLNGSNAMTNYASNTFSGYTYVNADGNSTGEFPADVPNPMFTASADFNNGAAWNSGTASDRVVIQQSEFETNFVNSAFTIEMWFKPEDLKSEQPYSWLCSQEGPNDWFGISLAENTAGSNSGRIRVNWSDFTEYNIYSGDNSVVQGEWHHLAVVFDEADLSNPSSSNELTIYINGVSQGSTSPPYPIDGGPNADFWIGSNPKFPDRAADSQIAGFKMYDVALTEAQVRQSMGKFLNWTTEPYNIAQPALSKVFATGYMDFTTTVEDNFISLDRSSVSIEASTQVSTVGASAFGIQVAKSLSSGEFKGSATVSTSGAYDIHLDIADLDGHTTRKTLLFIHSDNSTDGAELTVTGSDQATTIDGLVLLNKDLTLKGVFEMSANGYMYASSGKLKLGTFDVSNTTYSSALKVPSGVTKFINASPSSNSIFDNTEWNYNENSNANDAEFALEISVADEGWHAFYSPFKRASGGEVMYYNGAVVSAETANLYYWQDEPNLGTYGWTSATLTDIQTEHDGGNQGFIGWFGTGGIGDGDAAPWTFELRGNNFASSSTYGAGSPVTSSQWFSSTNEAANSNWILLGNTRPGYISRIAMLADLDAAFAPTLYVYDANSSGWTGLSGDDVIAPGQAFLVQADGNGPASYTQSADHMTSTLVAFRDEPCSIGLVATGAGINPDATKLVPNDGATIDFDPAFDVFHMGYGNAANLFTARNGVHFDKNCLPWSEGATHQEELHFHSPHPGTYTLSVIDSAMCWTGQRIEIENLETGEFHNLSNQPFAFDYDTVDEELVWTLHINRLGNLADEAFGSELDTDAAVSVESTDNEAAALTVVAQDGALQFAIAGDAAHVNWAGQIHDNSGRLVSEFQSQGRSNWSMPLNAQLTAGVYNINLRAAGQSALRATIYIH